MAKSKKSAPSQNNKRQNKDENDISQTIGPEAKKQKSDQSKGNSFDKACYLIEWKMSWIEIDDHTRLPEQSLKLQHWIFIEGTTRKMVSTQNADLDGKQQFQIISKDTRSVVIVERLSRNVVKDLNGQIFYLTGKFCNSVDLHFSPTSFEKFKDGFPEDWASIIAEECYRIYPNPVSQGQRTELHNQSAQISSNLDDEDKNMSDRSSTISCSDFDDDGSYAPQESLDNYESEVFQHQPFPPWMFENLNYLITHETKKLIHVKGEPEVQEIAYRLKEIAEQAKEKRNKVLNEDAHLNGLSSHQKIPLSVLNNIIKRLEKEIKLIDAECKSKKGPNVWVIRRRLYDILSHLWFHISIRRRQCLAFEHEQ